MVERQTPLLDNLAAEDEPEMDESIPDERLKLMFTCCHPALVLALEAQVALTLHTVGGLSTLRSWGITPAAISLLLVHLKKGHLKRLPRGVADDQAA